MLSYAPGETLAHRLDPRSKLCFQAGFAVAVLASGSVAWLAGMYVLAGVVLLAARLSPVGVVRSYRVVLAVLAVAPVLAGLTLGPPWFRVEPALTSLFAVSRVPPVLAVSAVYVRTTPVRGTRAAIQRLVPGRPGRLLGVGMALVFRFFPVVVADGKRVRDAVRSRAGDRASLRRRVRVVSVHTLHRAFDRADTLAFALRARCFAWNPTLPRLSFSRWDGPVLVAGVALALSPTAPHVRAALAAVEALVA